MTNILNLSVNELDSWLVEILVTINQATEILEIPFFIIGATARDLVMVHGHGAPIDRATRDVDFAVCVDSWDQYEMLKDALFKLGFEQDNRKQERLSNSAGHVIDIIPFGPISSEGSISWPPSWDTVMSVAGFDEAFESAINVRITNEEDEATLVSVASPAGIALLKLMAWQERDASIRPKDAQDLAYLCKHFSRDDSVSYRLYENNIMEKFDYEDDLASSFALGQDTASLASTSDKTSIKGLLNRSFQENGFDRLIEESMGVINEIEQRNRIILDAFRMGLDSKL